MSDRAEEIMREIAAYNSQARRAQTDANAAAFQGRYKAMERAEAWADAYALRAAALSEELKRMEGEDG
jgi:hypothetical protein